MKLQVAFDLTDLEKALSIATQIQDSVDIIEIGSLLTYAHGSRAVSAFRTALPGKTLLADAKIADRSKEGITHFVQAGADWITVLGGASRNTIKTACTTAHELGKRVMLDLIDASSLGQIALEAKGLGADAVLLHQSFGDEGQVTAEDRWDMVHGNTQLPVFITGDITRQTITEFIIHKPAGIVVNKAITHAENPAAEAAFFAQALRHNS